MSSRQEEKAKRRAEREEQERQAAASAANSRRLQIVGGVVLVIAAIAAIVVVATSGGGGDSGDAQKAKAVAGVKLPAVVETDLGKAAKKAGCVQLNPPNEGQDHVSGSVDYTKAKSNPPASGKHNPVPAEDGIYPPGREPEPENWIHSLEHGRIEIQYAPGTPKRTVDQLETLGSEEFNGSAGYHMLVLQNNTKMPYAVAAVAWTHVLGCKTMNNGVFDAVRAFRKQWTDQAPERIP